MATITGGWYTDGEVSVTNGVKSVTGASTAWLSQVRPGDMFAITTDGAGSEWYEIESITTDTSLSLVNPFAGTTGTALEYAVVRNFSGRWTLPEDIAATIAALVRDMSRAFENSLKGDPGEPGENGSTIYTGAGAPGTNLGDDNDYYIDVTAWDFYERETGIWTLLGNFKGGKGDAGVNGTKTYHGTGAPATSLGADGDFYMDTASGDMYVKVAQTGWGKLMNLMGPKGASITGPEGPRGLTGATGPAGSEWLTSPSEPPSNSLGRDNDICIITGTGSARGRYYKKLSGAWVYQGSIRGSTGDPGAPGPAGINWLGSYAATVTYEERDAVSYLGSSWVALKETTGNTPVAGEFWALLAQKGDSGSGTGDMLKSVYDLDGDGIVDYADEASHAASADSAAMAAVAQSVPDGVINHNTLASLHGGTPADEDVEAEMYHMTAAQNAAMVANARLSGSNAAASMLDVSESAQGLQNQINSIENRGLSVGSFDTFADLPTNASSFAAIEVNDYATVRADETHGGGLSRYVVTAIGTDGAITWEFDYALSTDEHGLRQYDLRLDGKFAAATTTAGLAAQGDFAKWELEPAALRFIDVRCSAADSGATPCSVQLMVNAAAVGGTVQAVASSWTTLAITGVTLNTGDQIEIAVTNTGTNKDSSDLRFVVVAEV